MNETIINADKFVLNRTTFGVNVRCTRCYNIVHNEVEFIEFYKLVREVNKHICGENSNIPASYAVEQLSRFLRKVEGSTIVISSDHPKYEVVIAWKDGTGDTITAGGASKISFPQAMMMAVDTANRVYEESLNLPESNN